mmetsp:Transcript_88594/g.247826  ORF Transcript_88594/g.247826 Transcript_88594/m.247826 type:complete len:215 (-) Transcript_88594:16-660(-)
MTAASIPPDAKPQSRPGRSATELQRFVWPRFPAKVRSRRQVWRLTRCTAPLSSATAARRPATSTTTSLISSAARASRRREGSRKRTLARSKARRSMPLATRRVSSPSATAETSPTMAAWIPRAPPGARKSHTRHVPSALPETRRAPDKSAAKQTTASLWPCMVLIATLSRGAVRSVISDDMAGLPSDPRSASPAPTPEFGEPMASHKTHAPCVA